MQTFSSREAQNKWGTVTDLAKREPVMITQYGRESFMIVPAALGRSMLGQAQAQHAASAPPSPPPQAAGSEALAKAAPQATLSSEGQAVPRPLMHALPQRRPGILEFLKQYRLPVRTRDEIDAALQADRDAWTP